MRQTILKLFDDLLRSVSFDRLFAKQPDLLEEISKRHAFAEANNCQTRLVAIGKSANDMTMQLANSCHLPGHVSGIIVTPYRPGAGPATQAFNPSIPSTLPFPPNWELKLHVSGHPLPNQVSLEAAEEALKLVSNSQEHDLTIFLISGGASAAFELPVSPDITLGDLQKTYQLLILKCQNIDEINSVRMAISRVKAGRLAVAAYPSQQFTLLISDVENELAAIGSGPTMYFPDNHSESVQDIVDKYQLRELLPKSVLNSLDSEHERIFKDDPRLSNSQWHCLASNLDLLENLQHLCRQLGWEAVVDTSCDHMPVEESAPRLIEKLESHQGQTPFAIISGGEMVSRFSEQATGQGGRNSAFVMETVELIAGKRIAVGSWASDGRDGSGQGGAYADSDSLRRGIELGLNLSEFRVNCDSFGYFNHLNDALICEPTHHNLRDARVLVKY